jgi:hypothetical protein
MAALHLAYHCGTLRAARSTNARGEIRWEGESEKGDDLPRIETRR